MFALKSECQGQTKGGKENPVEVKKNKNKKKVHDALRVRE
jgi:hypothetical protein